MKEDSKILIIGGTGFVGKHLEEALQQAGYRNVLAVSRSAHNVDVTQKDSLIPYISKSDIVINLAGFISYFRKDRKKLLATNYHGSLNVLDVCEKNKNVKKLIHLGSSSSFGFGNEIINEETVFNWSKYKKLSYCYSKFLPYKKINESKIHTNILYPPFVLGKYDLQGTKSLFDLIKGKKTVFTPPGSSNAFIDARDLAKAILLVMEKAENKKNYIVNDGNISYIDLFKAVAKTLGQKTNFKKIPMWLGKPLIMVAEFLEFLGFKIPSENLFLGFQIRNFDTGKIQRELHFSPAFDLQRSLNDAFNWLQQNNKL